MFGWRGLEEGNCSEEEINPISGVGVGGDEWWLGSRLNLVQLAERL